ncbi:hypothetical protein J2I47_24715 [Fibrella sp. HMF5335]|uniref:Uncharacterized protein n=1 Tax=Fibrella rubiginis TaxID=2817060 RepID=A0A939GMY7_9BACT|nr:hypothetical protein [Fibrella rubiginis]MBO0939771.1 hypothetical protein [Fibrella rubiginis]
MKRDLPATGGLFFLDRFVERTQDGIADLFMKTTKPLATRELDKSDKRKKKRNLDNSSLRSLFGKSPDNIWDKDIHTGEGNFSF